MRTALILGASGMVGGHLLTLLLEDPAYQEVTALVRRPLGRSHPRLREVQCDLLRPETYAAHVKADDVFCCLGTTMKKAGSELQFRQVDYEAPLLVARLAAEAGARQYVIVTAVGADAHSRIFYNRVKGELEDALRLLSFPDGVKVMQPSMLLGERGESRPLERTIGGLMRLTAPLFAVGLKRFRPIPAADVARAMRNAAHGAVGPGSYEGAALFALAAS